MGSRGRARQPRPGASAAPAAIIAPVRLAQQPPEDGGCHFLAGSVIDAGDPARDAHFRAQRMDRAVHGLLCRNPVDSAGGVMVWTWQRVAASAVAGLFVGGVCMAPELTLAALTGLAAFS